MTDKQNQDKGNKPNWNPGDELSGEEKKGVKRLGHPMTQDKAATLGQTDKDKANPEMNVDPRVQSDNKGGDSQLPPIEDKEKPEEDVEYSPGYMHSHVNPEDKVKHSTTDKSSTVTIAPPRRNPNEIPEPLIGRATPDFQNIPMNKEDLLTTIRAIVKVTSSDSQQLNIAMERIGSLIPANYAPVRPPALTVNPKDDSSKRVMTDKEYQESVKNRQ